LIYSSRSITLIFSHLTHTLKAFGPEHSRDFEPFKWFCSFSFCDKYFNFSTKFMVNKLGCAFTSQRWDRKFFLNTKKIIITNMVLTDRFCSLYILFVITVKFYVEWPFRTRNSNFLRYSCEWGKWVISNTGTSRNFVACYIEKKRR